MKTILLSVSVPDGADIRGIEYDIYDNVGAVGRVCRTFYVIDPAPEPAAWMPIESAPKDGSKIILSKIAEIPANAEFGISYSPPYVWWASSGFWSHRWNNWNDGIEPCGLANPNYWMPLPAVPSAETSNNTDIFMPDNKYLGVTPSPKEPL